MKTIMILAMICSLVIMGGVAFGATGKADAPAWRETDPSTPGYPVANPGLPNPTGHPCFISGQPTGWNLFEASWLIGHRVVTPWVDDYLGQISGLVIDRTNNRIAAVVLSDLPNSGGSWDGNRHLVLPYASIAIDIGQNKVVFNPGDMRVGPSLEPNYVIGSDPWVYALIIGGHPGLYTIPSTMDAAWLTDIYMTYGQVPYWEVAGQPEPSLVLIDSSNLMGARVQLSGGEAAGEIHDLVITPDGRIAFVVLSDFPDRPYTYVAVPFMVLSTENGLVLNVTSDQLANVAEFDEFSDLNNLAWASSVYSYFGVAPCWKEAEAH